MGLLRNLLGFALIGGGGAALGYGVNGMLRKFGLCTGRPGLNPEDLCMAGSGASEQIMAFAFGGIAAALLGAAVLAVRGPAGRAGLLSGLTAGGLAWLGLTLGVSVTGFWLHFGPDSIPDYSGGFIAGIGFGLMALFPLGMLWLGRRLAPETKPGAPTHGIHPVFSVLGALALLAGAAGAIALGNAAAPMLGHGGDEILRGDDPDSKFHAAALRPAVKEAASQMSPGEVVHAARITVDELRVQARSPSSAFPGRLPLSKLPVRAPERMINPINGVREAAGADAVTLDDVWWMDWEPNNPTDSEWDVLLHGTVSEPRRFQVSRDGSRARLWPAP